LRGSWEPVGCSELLEVGGRKEDRKRPDPIIRAANFNRTLGFDEFPTRDPSDGLRRENEPLLLARDGDLANEAEIAGPLVGEALLTLKSGSKLVLLIEFSPDRGQFSLSFTPFGVGQQSRLALEFPLNLALLIALGEVGVFDLYSPGFGGGRDWVGV